jgi:uncharacterized protein YbjT (DUF2867 family)
MVTRKYAVLGATGHTGHVVAEGLLARGHEVRVVGREQARLEPLIRRGAKPFPVELEHHVPALVEAFDGVDAVYAMIPPNYAADDYLKFEDHVGENIVEALKQVGTKWVVNLSSLGSELRSNTGPIVALHRMEKHLDKLHGVNVLHLRPAFFLEELLAWIPSAAKQDAVGMLFQKDLALELVATEDIGKKAVEFLDRLDFVGVSVLEVLGPHAVRMDEIVRILGKAFGKPNLAYRQLDEELEEKALLARGYSRLSATLWIEMEHAINEGRIHAHGTPFRGALALEKWVDAVFVPAYRQAMK